MVRPGGAAFSTVTGAVQVMSVQNIASLRLRGLLGFDCETSRSSAVAGGRPGAEGCVNDECGDRRVAEAPCAGLPPAPWVARGAPGLCGTPEHPRPHAQRCGPPRAGVMVRPRCPVGDVRGTRVYDEFGDRSCRCDAEVAYDTNWAKPC